MHNRDLHVAQRRLRCRHGGHAPVAAVACATHGVRVITSTWSHAAPASHDISMSRNLRQTAHGPSPVNPRRPLVSRHELVRRRRANRRRGKHHARVTGVVRRRKRRQGRRGRSVTPWTQKRGQQSAVSQPQGRRELARVDWGYQRRRRAPRRQVRTVAFEIPSRLEGSTQRAGFALTAPVKTEQDGSDYQDQPNYGADRDCDSFSRREIAFVYGWRAL